jgi:hypothetical protein
VHCCCGYCCAAGTRQQNCPCTERIRRTAAVAAAQTTPRGCSFSCCCCMDRPCRAALLLLPLLCSCHQDSPLPVHGPYLQDFPFRPGRALAMTDQFCAPCFATRSRSLSSSCKHNRHELLSNACNRCTCRLELAAVLLTHLHKGMVWAVPLQNVHVCGGSGCTVAGLTTATATTDYSISSAPGGSCRFSRGKAVLESTQTRPG